MLELLILLWLTRIAVTDVDSLRIPNVQIWPGMCAVIAGAAIHPGVGWAALAAASPYVLGFVLRRVGGGDVKLAAVCGGLSVRWDLALVMVLCASVVAATTALVAVTAARRAGREVPRRHAHAPALVLGTLLVSPLL